jgi:cytoskeletal protein RodZ
MAELKRKVTLKRKESPQEVKKKSKWWLWLLLVVVLIIVVLLFVRNCSGEKNEATDAVTPARAEQPATVAEKPSETDVTLAPEETVSPASEVVAPEASEQLAATPAAASAQPEPQGRQKPVTTPAQGGQPAVNPDASVNPVATLSQSTLEEKAKKVIRGDFGNGWARKRALGSEYKAIQQQVNKMYRNGEVY